MDDCNFDLSGRNTSILDGPILGKLRSLLMQCDVAPKLIIMLCWLCWLCFSCLLSILHFHLFDFGFCSVFACLTMFIYLSCFSSLLSSSGTQSFVASRKVWSVFILFVIALPGCHISISIVSPAYLQVLLVDLQLFGWEALFVSNSQHSPLFLMSAFYCNVCILVPCYISYISHCISFLLFFGLIWGDWSIGFAFDELHHLFHCFCGVLDEHLYLPGVVFG